MKTFHFLTVTAFLSIATAASAAEVRCVEPKNGIARAVIVGPAPLVHTSQLSAPEAGDLTAQIQTTFGKIDAALKGGGSSLAQAVKLNVYVTRDASAASVEHALATAFGGGHQPAVSFVTTPLSSATALVAIDAIGVATTEKGAADVSNHCAILPAGPRVYISGQAEKGDGSLADATAQTMASLGRTLEFLGLTKRDVVQVKSFLTPMTGFAEAEKAIAAFFGGLPVPPCSYVEWRSGLPIEIEMVVTAAGNAALADGASVEVRTPPGMTTPSVYSRLTISRHPDTIYISGLYPEDGAAAPEAQLRTLFTRLKQTLDLCGSDWMHLVKATYYVSDDELSKWHNTVRPDYFSPRRPPAASKAAVSGTGRADHGITMDFIVVPGEP